MIDQALASRTLKPLWALFPRAADEPGYQDLVTRALSAASEDPLHATKTVELLVRNSTFRPLPAEVHKAADTTRMGGESQPAYWAGGKHRCSLCLDMGWVVTDDGAVRCKHSEGHSK